jgi:hypothetical protein
LEKVMTWDGGTKHDIVPSRDLGVLDRDVYDKRVKDASEQLKPKVGRSIERVKSTLDLRVEELNRYLDARLDSSDITS